MADVITSNLELTKQEVGANDNTWGTILNTTLQLIDDGWGKSASVVTTGGDTTLTDSEEIVHRLNVTGTLASNANLIFSGRGGKWVISNNTSGSFTLTAKISGQTGITIPQGDSRLVFYNGTDIEDIGFPGLVAANNLSELASADTALTNLGLSANGKSLVTAANYAAMRTLLDLEAGTDFYSVAAADAAFQPLDTELTAIAGLTSAANKIPRFTGSGSAGLLDFLDEDDMSSNSATAVPSQQSVKAYVDAQSGGGTSLLASNNLSDLDNVITARGNMGLGDLAVLNTVNDDKWSGTDLAVANGGTGASSASGARSNLGLGSLATQSSINNGDWSGTDLALANGGTGASTAETARSNLSAAALPSSNEFPVGFVGLMRYTSGSSLADGDTTDGSNVRSLAFNSDIGSLQFDYTSGAQQTGTWKNISGGAMSASTTEVGYMMRAA